MLAIRLRSGLRALLIVLSALLFLGAAWGALESFRPVLKVFQPQVHGPLLRYQAFAVLAVCGAVWFWRGRALYLLVLAGAVALVALPAFRMGMAWTFLLFAWLQVLCLLLGQFALRTVVPGLLVNLSERIFLAVATGYGLLALVVFGLGLSRLLLARLAAPLLGGLTVLLVWCEADFVRLCFHMPVRQWWRTRDLRLPAFVLALALLCAPVTFWGALLPQTAYDSQTFRLAVPQLYCHYGAVVPVPEDFGCYWCNSGEMLFTLGLLLDGHALATLFHWTAGGILAGLIVCLGSRLAGPRTGWIAALLFYALPLVSYLSEIAYNDLFVCMFTFAAFTGLVRWSEDGAPEWLLLTAGMLGMAVNCKLNGLLFVLPVVVVVAWRAAVDARLRPPLLRGLVWPALLLGGVILPWRLYLWLSTGNPVFPFGNDFFQSPLWKKEYGNPTEWMTFGVGTGWRDFLRLPWDLNFRTEAFAEPSGCHTIGALGGLSLLGIPMTFWLAGPAQRRWLAPATVFVLVTAVLFFRTSQYTRYFLPLFPLAALLAAANVETFWGLIGPRRWRQGVLAAALLFIAGWFLCTRAANLSFGSSTAWQVALGQRTAQQYCEAIPHYPAQRFLGTQLGPAPRVYDAAQLGFRLFALPARLYSIWRTPELRRFLGRGTPNELVRAVLALQLDYVFIDAVTLQKGRQGFVQKCEPLFGRGGYFVYRVPPGFTMEPGPPPPRVTSFTPTSGPPGTQVVVTGNHFTNTEAIDFGHVPTVSYAVNSPTQITVIVPPGAKTGPVGARSPGGVGVSDGTFTVLPGTAVPGFAAAPPPPESSYGRSGSPLALVAGQKACWQGPLDEGALHLLRFYLRAAAPGEQSGYLALQWLDEQGKLLCHEGFPLFTNDVWQWREFPITTFPGASGVRIGVIERGAPLAIDELRWDSTTPPALPIAQDATLKRADVAVK